MYVSEGVCVRARVCVHACDAKYIGIRAVHWLSRRLLSSKVLLEFNLCYMFYYL